MKRSRPYSSAPSAFAALIPALAVALACSPEPDTATSKGATTVAVTVGGVGFDENSHVPVLLLEEASGGRVLPIWIGPAEARSIASEIAHAAAPRPNSHDLTKRLLTQLGAKVLRATVTELRGNTYYAVLRVQTTDSVHDVDARPSDAIAVALRFDAPLFVSSALFDPRRHPDRSKPDAEGAEPGAPEGLPDDEDGLSL